MWLCVLMCLCVTHIRTRNIKKLTYVKCIYSEDPAHVPGALNSMLRVMAEAKGWSLEHTAAITKMNAQRFYESGRAHHETLPSTLPVTPKDEMHVNAVRNAVTQQGDKVRRMKDANKAKASTFSQSELDQVIALLKSLKSQLPPS